jgi:hypothetical protein
MTALSPVSHQTDSHDRMQDYLIRINSSTRSEMHELGNLIVSLQYCLRQLGGRQSTDELEGVVRSAVEVCEQGIVAFRKMHQAVRVQEIPCDRSRIPAV